VAPVTGGGDVSPRHKWKLDETGEVDDLAYDVGYCNGPVCEVCGFGGCEHCDPDIHEDDSCTVRDVTASEPPRQLGSS
jgi:hypothetical protein